MPEFSEKTKERMLEAAMVVVGLVGLLVLFTVLFKGPSFIFYSILSYLNIKL